MSHKAVIRYKNRELMFIMTLLYFISIYVSNTIPAGQLLTILPLTVMLLISIWHHKSVVRVYAKGYFIYMLAFIIFCVLSRIWAEDSRLAVTKINSLIFAFLAMAAIVTCIYEKQGTDFLLKVIMYGDYCVCLYILVRYRWREILQLLYSSTRISDDIINANSMGMAAAYALVIDIYYISYDGLKLHNLLILPAIIMLAVSGSRKAIIVVIFGAFGILILKNIENRRMLRSIGKVFLITVGFIVFVYILLRLPIFSIVTRRMTNLISLLAGNETRLTSDAWIRLAYNRLGLDIFKSHPIVGIGIANAGIYTNAIYGRNHTTLHNNYVEMLACGGIVGFILYYSVWFYLLASFIKYRKNNYREYGICLILLLTHIIMDYGAVTYYGKETYFYLLLFWMEARKLRMTHKHAIMSTSM